MHSTHGFAVSRRTILLPPQNQIFSSPSEFSLAPRSDQDPRADRDYRRLGGADSHVKAVFGEEPHWLLCQFFVPNQIITGLSTCQNTLSTRPISIPQDHTAFVLRPSTAARSTSSGIADGPSPTTSVPSSRRLAGQHCDHLCRNGSERLTDTPRRRLTGLLESSIHQTARRVICRRPLVASCGATASLRAWIWRPDLGCRNGRRISPMMSTSRSAENPCLIQCDLVGLHHAHE